MIDFRMFGFVSALVLLMMPGLALAQAARRERPAAAHPASGPSDQKAPPPVSAEPQETSATFGDWVVRCNRVQEATSLTRVCEAAEALVVRGQQLPIAQIAIGRPPAASGATEAGLRLTLLLPTNISLESTPRVLVDANDQRPFVLSWRRCLPSGCFADAALPDDVVKRLRSATAPMRIVFNDAANREIGLPLSSRGLVQALNALGKYAAER